MEQTTKRYKGRRLSAVELALLAQYRDTFANQKFQSNLPQPRDVEDAIVIVTPQQKQAA